MRGSGQPVVILRNLYSANNVTGAAYLELDAVLSENVHEIEIFDSGAVTLLLAVGAAGSEVDTLYIFPGGLDRQSVSLDAGMRLSIKRADAGTTVSGEITINMWG